MYDVIIIGAGIYGRYASNYLFNKDKNILQIAKDDCLLFNQQSQGVASLVNQARVHNGYHYPRSIATAKSSVKHYHRFIDEFSSSIISGFKKVYSIPKYGSLTNANQFEQFCQNLGVQCEEYYPDFLNKQSLQGSWLVDEMAIDTIQMMNSLERNRKNELLVDEVVKITTIDNGFKVICKSGKEFESKHIINCTYANLNQIEFEKEIKPLHLKYEACEIALMNPSKKLKNIGITFMDGPFASFMPFSKDGLWSLTSVQQTPHYFNYTGIESVSSMKSNFDQMVLQLKQYFNIPIQQLFNYSHSQYVVKTILADSENDDNRLIKIAISDFNGSKYVRVLGGKLNAIYELDQLLEVF